MEEQMVKSTQNNMDYNLMTTLYEKNVGLIREAIDVGH
jgi:flagellar basal-body rod protein FlgB